MDPEILSITDYSNVIRLDLWRRKKQKLQGLKDAIAECLCDFYSQVPAGILQIGIKKAHNALDNGADGPDAIRIATSYIEGGTGDGGGAA